MIYTTSPLPRLTVLSPRSTIAPGTARSPQSDSFFFWRDMTKFVRDLMKFVTGAAIGFALLAVVALVLLLLPDRATIDWMVFR